jgi:hypothetical protein
MACIMLSLACVSQFGTIFWNSANAIDLIACVEFKFLYLMCLSAWNLRYLLHYGPLVRDLYNRSSDIVNSPIYEGERI